MHYHGLLHIHSACSGEGSHPLATLRKCWTGTYHFVMMTEHAEKLTVESYAEYVQECNALSDEQFRFIPGLEVATESGHMLLFGCREFICTRNPFEVIKKAKGCVIILAHPEQGHMLPSVMTQVDGIEGWNGRYMGSLVPPFDWIRAWRKTLHPEQIVTGGNDIHAVLSKRKVVTDVESPSMQEQAILEAIRAGQFTVSNGIFSFADEHAYRALLVLCARSYRLSRHVARRCKRVKKKLFR